MKILPFGWPGSSSRHKRFTVDHESFLQTLSKVLRTEFHRFKGNLGSRIKIKRSCGPDNRST